MQLGFVVEVMQCSNFGSHERLSQICTKNQMNLHAKVSTDLQYYSACIVSTDVAWNSVSHIIFHC